MLTLQFVKRIKSLVSRGASHPKMAALLQVVLGHFQQEQPPQTGTRQSVGQPGSAKPSSGSSTSNPDTASGVSADPMHGLFWHLIDLCYTPGGSVIDRASGSRTQGQLQLQTWAFKPHALPHAARIVHCMLHVNLSPSLWHTGTPCCM